MTQADVETADTKDGPVPFAGGYLPTHARGPATRGGSGPAPTVEKLAAVQTYNENSLKTPPPPSQTTATPPGSKITRDEQGNILTDEGGRPPSWQLPTPHGIPSPAVAQVPGRAQHPEAGETRLAWPSQTDYRDILEAILTGKKTRGEAEAIMVRRGLDPNALPPSLGQ